MQIKFQNYMKTLNIDLATFIVRYLWTYLNWLNLSELFQWQWGNCISIINYPDSKIHGASMGPTWGQQDPGGPHVGHVKLAILVTTTEHNII